MAPHLSTKNSDAFSLRTTLAKLHEDGMGDATLLSSVDGTSVPVHKFVMAMRSDFFRAKCFGEHFREFSMPFAISVDYEGRVLSAIKSFCYKDDCDNGFSEFNKKLEWVDRLSRHQRLDEVMTEEEMASSAVFLVSLAAAADYFLLTGLSRMLWKVAYQIMVFHLPETIPVIYGEAMNRGCEELRKLAWHSFWLSPQKVSGYSNEASGDGRDKSTGEESLPQFFKGPDPNVDYDGLGVILVMGCSDEDFNGDYYGTDTFVDDQSYKYVDDDGHRTTVDDIREYVWFEKKDKRGIRAYVQNQRCGEVCCLARHVHDELDDGMCYERCYSAQTRDRIPCEWEGVDGTGRIPPTCFVFKRGSWFPLAETISSGRRAGDDSESDLGDDSESDLSDDSGTSLIF